jgi:hypothetical protein
LTSKEKAKGRWRARGNTHDNNPNMKKNAMKITNKSRPYASDNSNTTGMAMVE